MAARLGPLTAALVPSLALACAATLTVAPGWAEDGGSRSRAAAHDDDRQRVPQTSDGVRGERALPLPEAFRVQDTWTTLQTYPVAPGVSFEQFTLTGPRKTL